MTYLIEQVAAWIQELIAAIGYPGIVIVMAIENIFPPIPSELVLPFAGALSAKGEMNFWAAVARRNRRVTYWRNRPIRRRLLSTRSRCQIPSRTIWQIPLHL